MSRLRRADEIVVADFEPFPQVVVSVDNAIGELDRLDAFLRRRALDLLPMLVGTSEEPNVVSHSATVARDHIGHDVFVHLPDVRVVVDVVDRCGDVELLRHEGSGIVAKLCA